MFVLSFVVDVLSPCCIFLMLSMEFMFLITKRIKLFNKGEGLDQLALELVFTCSDALVYSDFMVSCVLVGHFASYFINNV